MSDTEPAQPEIDWEAHWRQYAKSDRPQPGTALPTPGDRTGSIGVRGWNRQPIILDAGCGAGDLIRALKYRFPRAEFCGIEPSAEGVEAGRVLCPGVTFIQSGLYPLTDQISRLEGWASHAVCSEVLEHVEDPVALLRTVASCLKSGGTVVVTVPGGPRTAFDLEIGHLRHYTQRHARETVRAAGLKPVKRGPPGSRSSIFIASSFSCEAGNLPRMSPANPGCWHAPSWPCSAG